MEKIDIKLNLDLDGKKPDEQAKIINSNLKSIGDGLKAYAEGLEVEMKSRDERQSETKAHVDELLVEQTKFQAKLENVLQEMAAIPREAVNQKPKTLGEQILGTDKAKETLASLQSGASTKANFSINAALTNDTLDGLAEPYRQPGIARLGDQQLRIRDLLTWGRVSTNSVEFWRETTFTNNADVVSENPANGKPESSVAGSLIQVPVATIAHIMKASKQILDDVNMFQSYIDQRLRYGVLVKEEEQLLYGSGTGLEINGLHTQATAYSEPTGVDVTNETRVDRLRLAILQAELANYYADGVCLSLVDWTNIELQKDSQNQYLFANPYGMMTPTLWGRPVVASKSMETNDFLVGAFRTAAMAWDREMVNVAISYEDGDNFSENMVTLRGEERIALTVSQTGAFIKGDFDGLAS